MMSLFVVTVALFSLFPAAAFSISQRNLNMLDVIGTAVRITLSPDNRYSLLKATPELRTHYRISVSFLASHIRVIVRCTRLNRKYVTNFISVSTLHRNIKYY